MKNLTNTIGIDLSSNNGDIDISAYVNPDYYWTTAEPSGDDSNETEKKVNKIIDLLHKVGQKLSEL